MNNHNVTIMGESSLSGGGYGNVKILGNARAQDDLEAEKIRVLGEAEFHSLKVGTIKITGEARFAGPVEVNTLIITGAVEALERINA